MKMIVSLILLLVTLSPVAVSAYDKDTSDPYASYSTGIIITSHSKDFPGYTEDLETYEVEEEYASAENDQAEFQSAYSQEAGSVPVRKQRGMGFSQMVLQFKQVP
jgi:hypothetical protein